MPEEPAIQQGINLGRAQSQFDRMVSKTRKKIAEAKQTATERDEARAELESLKKQMAELAKVQTDTETLKAQLRVEKYRRVTDDILREVGIDPKAVDAFYKLADLKFDGDEPDPIRLKASILAEREKPGISNLFKPTGSSEPAVAGESSPGPAPGRGQGGDQRGSTGPFQATRDQLRDPAYCFAHEAELRKVSKEIIEMPSAKTAEKFVVLGT